jgi:DNA-binding CsgD family transcriptional regulator
LPLHGTEEERCRQSATSFPLRLRTAGYASPTSYREWIARHQVAAFFAIAYLFGSPRYRAEAERELRWLGRSIHRHQAGETDEIGVESLTERERQVARLVVDRKANREIAEALFLSPKTVETHMRNIFRKLDVSSRVEVARAVERADQAERALSR